MNNEIQVPTTGTIDYAPIGDAVLSVVNLIVFIAIIITLISVIVTFIKNHKKNGFLKTFALSSSVIGVINALTSCLLFLLAYKTMYRAAFFSYIALYGIFFLPIVIAYLFNKKNSRQFSSFSFNMATGYVGITIVMIILRSLLITII